MFLGFGRMMAVAWPYRRLYLPGLLALLVVDLLDTFTPKAVQWALGHLRQVRSGEPVANPLVTILPDAWFAPDGYLGGMWVYAVLVVLVVGLAGVFRYPMSMGFSRATVALTHDLRGRLFAHLQRLDARWHDTSKVGDAMSLATNDAETVRMFFGIGLLILADTILYFVFVPLFMVSISWKLLLASLITLPLIPVIVARLTHTVERRSEAVQAQFATVAERARESYAGARVVKSFAREEAEVRSFAALCRQYLARYMHFARVFAIEQPSLTLMLGLVDLVVVLYGGHLALTGEIQWEEFAIFFQYLIRLSGPMIGLGWTLMLYQRGRASMRRIEQVLAVEPRIVDPADPAPVAGLRGDVEIRHLTFRFTEDGPPVLEDIDLRVPAGGRLGIVGRVGSGKSALLQLLPRLYDPPPGTVFVDGVDVRQVPLDVLRTAIGSVPQDTYLFSETIRQNIALGQLGREDHGRPVEESARLAHVEADVLGFPKGYDTLLGERGVNLSGGQKQRVAIARALARQPAILLLDDCLSAVDTETEAAILRGLSAAGRRCTVLVASHRVSAVRDADEIVVLAEGRIVERGTHAQLVRRGGLYAELDAKQRLAAAVD